MRRALAIAAVVILPLVNIPGRACRGAGRPAARLRRGGRGVPGARERAARRLLPGVTLGRPRRPAQQRRRIRPHAPDRRRRVHRDQPPRRRRRGPARRRQQADARPDRDARPRRDPRLAAHHGAGRPADRREPRRAPRPTPAANIRGGAALLADYQKSLGAPLSDDPGQWYGAVARYSGRRRSPRRPSSSPTRSSPRSSRAHERVTDDGQRVTAGAGPQAVRGRRPGWRSWACARRAGTASSARAPSPASGSRPPTRSSPPDDYGNHDLANRPTGQKIDYIVIHDMEGYFGPSIRLVQDATYGASWHYSAALHRRAHRPAHQDQGRRLARRQLVRQRQVHRPGARGLPRRGRRLVHRGDVPHLGQAGALPGARYGIPLDRAHILGHDNVPGTLPTHGPGHARGPGPLLGLGALLRAARRAAAPARRPEGGQRS